MYETENIEDTKIDMSAVRNISSKIVTLHNEYGAPDLLEFHGNYPCV